MVETYDEGIDDILYTSNKYAFLVGAGISMNPPSNLPSARQIVKGLLEKLIVSEEVENILNIPDLRYEMIVEQLQKYIDPNLIFMDYFELIKNPNMIHFMLALSIINGNSVSTTNFDYLIELALGSLVPVNEQNIIMPIIVSEDFINLSDAYSYKIFKLHGSKSNIITHQDTSSSLITTISALGKDRELDKTFTIEKYKKNVLIKLFRNNCLIIMGYSGGDDFDISPLLFELPSLDKLIWIDHTIHDIVEIKKIDPMAPLNSKDLGIETSHAEKLLKKIRSNSKFEIYYIKANTIEFIKKNLWIKITNKDFQEISDSITNNIDAPSFSDWIRDKYNDISAEDKYKITAHLYFNLGRNKDVIRTCEKALELFKDLEQMDPKNMPKAEYHQLLGTVNRMKGDFGKSNKHFKDAKDIEMLFFNQIGVAKQLINVADNYKSQTLYSEAEKIYKEAQEIYVKHDNLEGQLTIFHRLGELARINTLLDKAEEYFLKSSELISKTGNLERKAAIINSMGLILAQNGDYISALKNFQESLDIVDKIGDLNLKGEIIENIGLMYETQGDFQNALLIYQKALNADIFMDNTVGIISRMNRIGDLLLKLQKADEALTIFLKALKIYNIAMKENEIEGPMGKSELLFKIGTVLKQKARFTEALPYFNEGFHIEMYLFRPKEVGKYALNLAESYESMGDKQSAIVHYKDAIFHIGAQDPALKKQIEERLHTLEKG
ncbi:MAG: tetratricopeptide repeat protein [Promethearchaeota archaeon]|nr:MAG: tetratricopeptide repeat protein [Candidatus Lokiarchaeota archaeon]